MRQWTIDAFASAPFMGNIACVVGLLEEWPPTGWMNQLAAENNQSETAFLKRTARSGEYELRCFTPVLEVNLAGHAILAAAHVLKTELGDSSDRLVFYTKSGELSVRPVETGYEMNLPADTPRKISMPKGLTEALGGPVPQEAWAASFLMLVFEEEADIRNVYPDMGAIQEISKWEAGGRGDLIVTATANYQDYDVASRFFSAGADEGPATGSAHCVLAPYWSGRLGKSKLRYHQFFPGRGADMVAEVQGARVLLQGSAMTVVDSNIRIQP